MRIGVDLISSEKFADIGQKDYVHWEHVFSNTEWGYAFRDGNHAEHLAGIFAVKEAAMKALGTVGVKELKGIKVEYSDGAPGINYPGSSVSVSHYQNLVVAVVIVQ
jgi:phosphopantetheine--protein transferase-like protein